MRIYSAIILFSLLLIQLFSTIIMTASWELNREYITATQCVNVLKPEIQCKGKCQLAKQIKKMHAENENDSGKQSQIKFQQIDQFISIHDELKLVHSIHSTSMNEYIYKSNFYCFNYHFKSIKPPINEVC